MSIHDRRSYPSVFDISLYLALPNADQLAWWWAIPPRGVLLAISYGIYPLLKPPPHPP